LILPFLPRFRNRVLHHNWVDYSGLRFFSGFYRKSGVPPYVTWPFPRLQDYNTSSYSKNRHAS
jgi:hypothetical protein